MIVIDASIAMTWFLDDETTPGTDDVFLRVRLEGGLAPSLWPLEMANAFRTAVRKRRMSLEKRQADLSLLSKLSIEIRLGTHEQAWTSILALSDKHNMTPYDAAYLELAVRERLPLASLDKELLAAARAESVEVLP